MSREDVEEVLKGELARLLFRKGVTKDHVTEDISLIDGLGVDSFEFVDLTLAIEQKFGINRFPMQLWIDSEGVKREARFTVGSLVDWIVRYV